MKNPEKPDLQPLGGVRVMDLSRVLAGPYCTMVLSDLGADVVKVERPGEGDETRSWGPPYSGGESAYYLSTNRNKRSCAIDLKQSAGRKIAIELCERSDVVIHNFRRDTIGRLGLSHEDLRLANPRIIHCTITGFGSNRAPANRPSYDFIAQAESGLMSITGDRDGDPTKMGVGIVDVLTGLNAAVAIVAALYRREQNGEGELIEVSLLDSALASLVNVGQGALVTGEEPNRYGNAHPNIVPYQPFRAADGWIAVAAANDGLYRRLCEALGRRELAEDGRFLTNDSRVQNREELIPLLEACFAKRDADEWIGVLGTAGVPAGKVRGVRDALDAAADAGASAVTDVPHPTAEHVELVNPPFTFGISPLRPPEAPPLLGQHTGEVLSELGYADEVVTELESLSVVQTASKT